MEARLQVDGRELLRQLLQDHLDLRARRETRPAAVIGAGGVARGGAETGRERKLTTVFGQVQTQRVAYGARGHADLHPAARPVAGPTSLLTGKDVEVKWTANDGPSGGKQWEHLPARGAVALVLK